MDTFFTWVWLALALFLGILAMLEAGWRIGCEHGKREAATRAGVSLIDGSIYGLFGLLLAFTFSSAASRFDDRRKLIVAEVNAIGTAWARIDLLLPERQAALRQHYRDYFDARLGCYSANGTEADRHAQLAAAQKLQALLWADAVAAGKATPDARVATVLLPAINEMFDVATMRVSELTRHQPTVIFVLLCTLALACALLIGHAMSESQRRNWLHRTCYAALIALTFYVILDFEHPRAGMIRVDGADQALLELRASMN